MKPLLIIMAIIITCAATLLLMNYDDRISKTKKIILSVERLYALGKAAGIKTIDFRMDETGQSIIIALKTDILKGLPDNEIQSSLERADGIIDGFGKRLFGQEVHGKIEISSAGKDGIFGTDDDIGNVQHLTFH